MKILIAYAGKTGTTEKCAGLLAQKLPGATLCDLNVRQPDAGEYDLVVVGGSIRAGMMHRAAKRYVAGNLEKLKQCKTAFFVCSADPDRPREMLCRNLGEPMVDAAICTDSFGGEMDIEKQSWLWRQLMKAEQKKHPDAPKPHILPQRIDAFAQKLTEAAAQ